MAVSAPPRARRGRRIAAVLLVVAVALCATVVAVLAAGAFDRYPRTALLWPRQQARAPAWTRPCWPTARWTDKAECQHVRGRVVWIQKHDPDGDGDRHLLVIDRLHPRIVKLSRALGVARVPPIGARIDAVGWAMFGASGRPEINTQRLIWDGTTKSTQTGAVISLMRRPGVG